MSHQEVKVQKMGRQVAKRTWFKQVLNVVSNLSLNDVTAVESAVHEGHNAQLQDIDDTVVHNLETIVGLPVHRFMRSGPLDVASWDSTGKVGEYHRSGDGRTFAYSKMIEVRGRERVIRTSVFTNMPPDQVLDGLGAPMPEETQQQDGKIVPFVPREVLRPTG